MGEIYPVITPALRLAICADIQDGLSQRKACAANGVAWSTFNDTKVRDAEFATAIAQADGLGCRFHARRLRTTTDPVEARVSQFYLATHDRAKFSLRADLRHSGNVTMSIVDLLHGAVEPADGDSGDVSADEDL